MEEPHFLTVSLLMAAAAAPLLVLNSREQQMENKTTIRAATQPPALLCCSLFFSPSTLQVPLGAPAAHVVTMTMQEKEGLGNNHVVKLAPAAEATWGNGHGKKDTSMVCCCPALSVIAALA